MGGTMFDEATEHLIKKTVFDAMWTVDDYEIITSESVEEIVDYTSKYCIPSEHLRDILNKNVIRLANGSTIKIKENMVTKVLQEMDAKRKLSEKTIKEKAESGEGVKDTLGKPDWSLVDLKNLEGMVRGLEYGCKKYARDNWKKVKDPVNNYYSAALRHLAEWHSGKKNDAESHLNHLYHAMCNIYFLTYFEEHPEEIQE